jgi:hypothetical protein
VFDNIRKAMKCQSANWVMLIIFAQGKRRNLL